MKKKEVTEVKSEVVEIKPEEVTEAPVSTARSSAF